MGVNGAWGRLGDGGLGFGENLCMLRKCHRRVLGALSKKLRKYGRFIMSLFKLRPKGAGDQSGLLQEQLFWSFCLRAIHSSQTHVMGSLVVSTYRSNSTLESSILHLFSSLIRFIRRNPQYLPSTLLPSTSSTLQVALLSTLLTVATSIARASLEQLLVEEL